MRCPKCGYNSFEHNLNCPKCHKSIVPTRKLLGVSLPEAGLTNFFTLASQHQTLPMPFIEDALKAKNGRAKSAALAAAQQNSNDMAHAHSVIDPPPSPAPNQFVGDELEDEAGLQDAILEKIAGVEDEQDDETNLQDAILEKIKDDDDELEAETSLQDAILEKIKDDDELEDETGPAKEASSPVAKAYLKANPTEPGTALAKIAQALKETGDLKSNGPPTDKPEE